jgi:hypothetical protein
VIRGRVIELIRARFGDEFARQLLTGLMSKRTRRLVVFLTPGHEARAGGIMTIADFYNNSRALKSLHGAKVVLCGVPGDGDLLKYRWFRNDNYILNLEAVLKHCDRLESLLLHVPEYIVSKVVAWLASVSETLLSGIKEVHINVMLQNIDLVLGQDVSGLSRFGKVTCTTGHEAYTNAEVRARFGVPVHRLAPCNGPERYTRTNYRTKKNILMVSPDGHALRAQVLARIAAEAPNLPIQVVENLDYHEYRQLADHAKWSLTFGEGLDAYFADPFFSGGVSFAVFNPRFFTAGFAGVETVYPDWETLLERMPGDLRRLDEPIAYKRAGDKPYELLAALYSTERSRQDLRKFYRREYTFP